MLQGQDHKLVISGLPFRFNYLSDGFLTDVSDPENILRDQSFSEECTQFLGSIAAVFCEVAQTESMSLELHYSEFSLEGLEYHADGYNTAQDPKYVFLHSAPQIEMDPENTHFMGRCHLLLTPNDGDLDCHIQGVMTLFGPTTWIATGENIHPNGQIYEMCEYNDTLVDPKVPNNVEQLKTGDLLIFSRNVQSPFPKSFLDPAALTL